MPNSNTSWEKVNNWYKNSVNEKGHYYHQNIVIPNSLKLLNLKSGKSRLLDLACGQGVLSRHINNDVEYLGIDLAKSLIESAKELNKNNKCFFETGDITKPLKIKQDYYTDATVILALQNVNEITAVFTNAQQSLQENGNLLLVLNHPYFRIPKVTSWGIDEQNQIQYRRVDAYMTPLEIPILHEPSKGENSPVTWSYHHPLHTITQKLSATGFVIVKIEEWVSDKQSIGKNSKRENISREEIPMFMAILCVKIPL